MADMTAQRLRDAMVDQVIADRAAIAARLPSRVEQAMRTVPRHLFVPDLDLADAYALDAPVTKRDEHGVAISSVSAPSIMAMMLSQADIRPGMRVLEIGSGGPNAALIAELAGPHGAVTTMDIDPEVTARATAGLTAAGYTDRVTAITGDGWYGEPQGAPWDRIIVTAGAADIAPAWIDQLTTNGRLVVPIRIRGLTRSVAFERAGDRLIGRTYEICGFVPLQGIGQDRRRLVRIHDAGVSLHIDDRQPVDVEAIRWAMTTPRVDVWSHVTIGAMEPFDNLDLWVATMARNYACLTATRTAVDSGAALPVTGMGASCIFEAESFAYLTARPTTPERRLFELGAFGYGPAARPLAERLVHHVHSWTKTIRRSPAPHIDVYPKSALDTDLPPGLVVDKPHSRLTVSWPRPGR